MFQSIELSAYISAMRLGTGIQNCLRSTREIEVWPWWSSPESAEPPLEACDEEGGQVSKGCGRGRVVDGGEALGLGVGSAGGDGGLVSGGPRYGGAWLDENGSTRGRG